MLSDLSKFEILFQGVDCNDEQKEVTSVDGVQVLKGGRSYEMSEDIYNKLRGGVTQLRQQIIETNFQCQWLVFLIALCYIHRLVRP